MVEQFRRQPSTANRSRSSTYSSPFDMAARRWRHPDFVSDEDGITLRANKEETTFRFFDLPPPYVAPPNTVLPAHDVFGWPHGEAYRPLLKARTPLYSTRTVMPGLKLDRLHHALSTSEFRILLKLALHPAVLDIREQYGIYNRAAFWRAKADNQPMLRKELMTIDVIVTYALPPCFELKYHAISVKSPRYVASDADIRRESRERQAMAEVGWTWELLRGDAVSLTEFANLRFIYGLLREQDFTCLHNVACLFASALATHSNRGTLDAMMLRVARSQRLSIDDAYHRFSASVAYGLVQVDHNYPLAPNRQLRLLRCA